MHLIAHDANRLERLVEHSASWPDKRLARQVFCIARLFADEQHGSVGSTFTEDRLRSTAIEIAALAVSGCLFSSTKRRPRRHERRRRLRLSRHFDLHHLL